MKLFLVQLKSFVFCFHNSSAITGGPNLNMVRTNNQQYSNVFFAGMEMAVTTKALFPECLIVYDFY